MKTFKYFIIFVFTVVACNSVKAQCCGAGNPVSGFGNVSGMSAKTLVVAPMYRYSFSDQYYTGSDKADIAPDKSYYNFVGLDLSYGITDRLSVQGHLGYFINKTKVYNIEGWSSMAGYGLGDAEINVKYAIIKRVFRKIDVVPGIGVKLPVGVFDQVVDDVKLPISLQPSSGSLKYNFNVFVLKRFDKHSISCRVLVEFANRIQSENFDYEYGNLYLFSVYGSFKLSKKLNLLSQLRYEYRDKSVRENEQTVVSSGGQVVFFIPQINVMATKSIGLSLYADIPVYKYLNGTQLSNKFALSLKVIKSFGFDKNNEKLNH